MQTYTESYQPVRAGVKASLNSRSISRRLTAACKAGIVVVPGATDVYAKAPAADGDRVKALGVLVYNSAAEPTSASFDFAADEMGEIVTEGEIWCICETAMADGAQPYVRFTAGAGETAGALRNDTDAGDAGLLPNARVVQTASGSGVCCIRINAPYGAAS